MGCSGLKPIMRANFLPNVVQRSRVLHCGVSRDYRAKVGDLPEQEIQVGDLLNKGRSCLASGTDEPLSVRPLRGLAAVCFCHVASKNGTKLLSSDTMIIIKLCLQLSEELMVSFFVSCHCLYNYYCQEQGCKFSTLQSKFKKVPSGWGGGS